MLLGKGIKWNWFFVVVWKKWLDINVGKVVVDYIYYMNFLILGIRVMRFFLIIVGICMLIVGKIS